MLDIHRTDLLYFLRFKRDTAIRRQEYSNRPLMAGAFYSSDFQEELL